MQFIPMPAYLRAYISLIFLMPFEPIYKQLFAYCDIYELQERVGFELD
jgi:hypothetical protein